MPKIHAIRMRQCKHAIPNARSTFVCSVRYRFDGCDHFQRASYRSERPYPPVDGQFEQDRNSRLSVSTGLQCCIRIAPFLPRDGDDRDYLCNISSSGISRISIHRSTVFTIRTLDHAVRSPLHALCWARSPRSEGGYTIAPPFAFLGLRELKPIGTSHTGCRCEIGDRQICLPDPAIQKLLLLRA